MPAVGTLGVGATSLRYESVTHSVTGQRMGKKNESVALFLSLVPSMALVPGERVTVHLTAFLGPASAGDFLTSEPPGLFRAMEWSNTAANQSVLDLQP